MPRSAERRASALPLRFLLRQARHELRALIVRGALFVACLATGVAAVVSVAGISDAVQEGLRLQSRELLAADLRVSSRQPLPESVVAAARALPGARVARVTELYSMVFAPDAGGEPGRSQLVDLKAVEDGWPFHGSLEVDPPRPLGELLDDQSALIAPALARRLGLAPGDRIRVGDLDLVVAGFVLAEPDHELGRVALAPRVLVTQEAAEASGLLGAASRQERALLVALAGDADAESAATTLRAAAAASPFVAVETWKDAQPQVRRQVERAERFLGLIALLSLVIGGAGIAQASRAWLASRVDAIALLRCLGLRPRDVLALFVSLAAALGALGSVVGAAAGLAAVRAAPPLLEGLLDGVPLPAWQPAALLRGLALGLGAALASCLPTLVEILRVPPLRALRSSVEPPPASRRVRALTATLLAAAGLAAAAIQAESLLRGALFAGVLGATTLALAGAARLVSRVSARLLARARGGTLAPLRLAGSALVRPGRGVLAATVALGLGVLVVLTVLLVQRGLRAEILSKLPADAPSEFFVDVQPSQWPAIEAVLARHGATSVQSTPLVTARLRSIDGRDVAEIARERKARGRDDWPVTREQRLTWRADLPEDNRIVAGAPWSDASRAEVSVEEEYARDLGLEVGTRVEMDVQGVPVELLVTSLRRVEWRTFRINFFFLVEPGVLEAAPHSVLAAARLPEGREDVVQDEIVALAPNVTCVPVRDALDRLASLVMRLAAGVRAVGAFAALAGIAILAGAVAAGASRRGAEVALLKTLGMTRRQVAAMLVAEHAAIGATAALVGAGGASLLSWVVLTRLMELPWRLQPATLAAGVAATIALAAASGTLVSWPSLRRRPIEALRREG